MDSKILRFFNKIGFDEEKHLAFEGSEITKVDVDAKAKTWTIYINMDSLVDIEIFKELHDKSNSLKDVKKVYFVFNTKTKDKINDYFNFYFDKLADKCPTLLSIKENVISFNGNKITIETLNKTEFDKVEGYKKKIATFLKSMGFDDVELETIINDEARKEFKESLKVKDVLKVEKKDNLVYGRHIQGDKVKIKNIIAEEENIILEVFVFGKDAIKTQTGLTILTFKISDYSDSINAKMFVKNPEEADKINGSIQVGSWYKMKGSIRHDNYEKDLVYTIRDIESLEKRSEKRFDDAEEKRVELHLHTRMSAMDGLIDWKKLLKKVGDLGQRAVGITDKNTIQAFPKLYKNKGDLKIVFGVELYVIDDEVQIISSDSEYSLKDTFVVWDFETTGLNAAAGDSIIEIGAVKIKNGEIIDRYDELVNPGIKLREQITSFTNITDDMLKDKDNEETAFKRFKDWYGDLPMVAQNAKFDVSFIESAYRKYNLGKFDNIVLDTMELSKILNPDESRHNLTALAKRYKIEWDETSHHRGDYDAEGTAMIFYKMINGLGSSYKVIKDLNNLIDKESIHKNGRPFHMTVYAQNDAGLKNLFKVISYANTKYFYKVPRMLKSELRKLREGLIFGSGCINGEIYEAAKTKGEEDLINMMRFYDFIEVNPPSIQRFLVEKGEFSSMMDVETVIKKIITSAESIGKLVCATGDVHTLDPDDNIYREILVNQKSPGGGLHPLSHPAIKTVPNAFLMTTKEMLEEFSFLDSEKAKEIVVTNTNKIVDMVEDVTIVKEGLFSPKMENSEQTIKDIVYTTAKNTYGEVLPEIIETRLSKELTGIIGGQYDVIYLIAQKLVAKSNSDGYIVGSRGSVGSSLVATFLNITEVNPLPPHYVCPNCKKSLFEVDGKPLSMKYGSGFDMPDRMCECGTKFKKQGQDIPFETFLGFNADKTPDIDLNFSGEYQAKAHDYTRVLFGPENVYRAGTVISIAEKTAYGFVKGYMERKGVSMRRVEIERLAGGITGIKRTSSQHPGGIIVIPAYKDVFDFTPYQYPADDPNADWLTTHFEFHDIEENVLKLDILGHDDPTVLKYLLNDIDIDINDIPMDDPKVLSLFSSPDALDIKQGDIRTTVGTLGVPEFGTGFVMKLLEEVRPTTFAELLKVSGLSHGTGVWAGNARDVLLNKICEFKEVIGCRDDIMLFFIKCGIDKGQSFKMSEFIRKGKVKKDPETWKGFVQVLKEYKVPEWYIGCCEKIEYMFPKAHAAAYVTNGCRVAWFKVYHPLSYYRVFLSIRKSDYDIETMVKGQDAIVRLMDEITEKGYDASVKESAILGTLQVANELYARGFKIDNLSLNKSEAKMFIINDDKTGLIPPFTTIDGLGEAVATKIVEERNKRPFVSIEDLQARGKVSATLVDKMRSMGMLEGMPESSQLSLF